MNLITRIWLKLLKEWWQIYVPFRLRAIGVVLGKNVRFYGMPIVRMTQGSSIRIGDRVVLCSDSRFTDLGVNHPVVLRTLRADAQIVIGNDSGISGGSICAAISVVLGKECLLGANVTIADTDFHAIKPEGRRFNGNPLDIGASAVRVEDNVFIGTGALVLKGVTIGKNSVIGAMSVVNKNVDANVIVAGSPVRMIREIKNGL
ncbi:MAG: acyltransferase [Sideroxydans sp.]|nr:acyltransferase [Sideroxydans sp.]